MSETGQIRVLTTGGTIDKIYFDSVSAFEVGDPQVGEALRQANVQVPVEIVSLLRKDSLDFTVADREVIAKAVREAAERCILITHGTDTMAQTGASLQPQMEKTVVLTGALLPARLRDNDALFNIGFAFAAVQLLPPGVYLAMNGRIFDPEHAQKNRAANRFEEV